MADLDLQERAADFLDDKLQTLADLDALDHLLEETRSHHALLKHQVRRRQLACLLTYMPTPLMRL